MNSKTWTRIIAVTFFAALAVTVPLAAQDTAKQPHQYHHYQLIDPGTFGGPQSFQTLGGIGVGVLNNGGAFGGWADTSAIDPLCFFDFPDCYAAHAFVWQNGAKTDLGLLPGGTNSQVNWISANGLVAGVADNGQMDPLIGIPQIRGFLGGQNTAIVDVGTLPGAYFANPMANNDLGQIVGFAANTIPDANSMAGLGYQTRAFVWDATTGMQDIGTLPSGTDAMAGVINERGQVVGWSYTSLNLNLDNLCFGNALTTGSFIWDKTSGMRDIGNLGGSSCTVAHDLNRRGQIVGGSDIPLELQHPFVWDSATGMTDLGTPDGGYGVANALNEQGDVVGLGEANGGPSHAMLWRKLGGKWQMMDLGAMGSDCGFAESINASRQIIGIAGSSAGDGNCDSAFFSDDGGPMVNLNALIPPNSGLQINEAGQINDRGEITVNASDASGNNHAVLLIPCDEGHPGVEGCDYSMVDAATAARSAAPRNIPSSTLRPPHSWRSNRYRMRGLQSPSK
jgi:probable HAF family extracellular repeat protein